MSLLRFCTVMLTTDFWPFLSILDVCRERVYKMSRLLFQRTGQRPLPFRIKVKLIRFKISIVNKPTECLGCYLKERVNAHCPIVSRSNWSDSRYPSWTNLQNVLAVVSKDRSAPTAWSCQVKLIRFKIAIVNKPTKCPGCCYKGQVSAHCLVVSRSNWFDSRYPSWNNLVSR